MQSITHLSGMFYIYSSKVDYNKDVQPVFTGL